MKQSKEHSKNEFVYYVLDNLLSACLILKAIGAGGKVGSGLRDYKYNHTESNRCWGKGRVWVARLQV